MCIRAAICIQEARSGWQGSDYDTRLLERIRQSETIRNYWSNSIRELLGRSPL